MARAILSYGYLPVDKAFNVLMETFQLYKNYFMKLENSEDMAKVVKDAEKIKAKFTTPEEKSYAGIMIAAFMDEIELSYTETVNTESKTA